MRSYLSLEETESLISEHEWITFGEIADFLYGNRGITYDSAVPIDWLLDAQKRGLGNGSQHVVWIYPDGAGLGGMPGPLTLAARDKLAAIGEPKLEIGEGPDIKATLMSGSNKGLELTLIGR